MSSWIISQKDFDVQSKKFYESIFALGNGYMGVRGFDEEEIRDAKHEINTFIAGVFDYYAPGKTDMVNSPTFGIPVFLSTVRGLYQSKEKF